MNILLMITSDKGLISLPRRTDILDKIKSADKVIIRIDSDEHPSRAGFRALSIFITQVEALGKSWEILAYGRTYIHLAEIKDHYAEVRLEHLEPDCNNCDTELNLN